MIGTKLAQFEITAHLGSGGMGDVYQASDSKLGRNVAVKFLPKELARDSDRVARFEREARVLASLNHPNIAAIYGLEHSGDQNFLVMELVGGETLAERIRRGALPLDEAVTIAKQICDGLEGAHEKGVVHRDLKPANIKVTADGKVKVLDFGLAKAIQGNEAEGPNANLSNAPTMSGGNASATARSHEGLASINATNAGAILGTAGYMSPEQARGKTVDRRADIWAFGCVLYEMVTGRKPFEGEDAIHILAAVVRSDPDWSAVPPHAAAVLPILRRCLKRDPGERLRDAHDLRIALDDLGDSASSPTLVSASQNGSVYKWLFAVATIAAIIATAALAFQRWFVATPLSRATFTSIESPPGEEFARTPTGAALSPNGRYVAFITTIDRNEPNVGKLWVRDLQAPDSKPIEGAANASTPFWSPDSEWIAFFSDRFRNLKKVRVEGGRPVLIADATGAGGGRFSGTWNRDNVVVVGLDIGKGLYRTSAEGGKLVPLTTPQSIRSSHFRPHFLPDGNHFLFYEPLAGVYAGSLNSNAVSKDVRQVLSVDSTIQYDPSSRNLLFVKDDTLWAQEFDAASLQVRGQPLRVLDAVFVRPGIGYSAGFSVAANDSLLYRPAMPDAALQQLTWLDRSGKQISLAGKPAVISNLRLSSDGHRAAVQVIQNGNDAIWIMDAASALMNRLTFSSAETDGRGYMSWSPDGRSISYSSGARLGAMSTGDTGTLYRKLTSGEGNEEIVIEKFGQLNDLSPDGQLAVGSIIDPLTNRDIFARRLSGDPKLQPIAATAANETQGQISPDGKLIAYTSDENGTYEIFVQSFPAAAGKRLVSAGGGVQARWRRDGKELFYLGADGSLMAIPVSPSTPVSFGAPVALFKAPSVNSAAGLGTLPQYDVTPDGQRFLFNVRLSEPPSPPIRIILNWTTLLKK